VSLRLKYCWREKNLLISYPLDLFIHLRILKLDWVTYQLVDTHIYPYLRSLVHLRSLHIFYNTSTSAHLDEGDGLYQSCFLNNLFEALPSSIAHLDIDNHLVLDEAKLASQLALNMHSLRSLRHAQLGLMTFNGLVDIIHFLGPQLRVLRAHVKENCSQLPGTVFNSTPITCLILKYLCVHGTEFLLNHCPELRYLSVDVITKPSAIFWQKQLTSKCTKIKRFNLSCFLGDDSHASSEEGKACQSDFLDNDFFKQKHVQSKLTDDAEGYWTLYIYFSENN
jgi:hypothetical protein